MDVSETFLVSKSDVNNLLGKNAEKVRAALSDIRDGNFNGEYSSLESNLESIAMSDPVEAAVLAREVLKDTIDLGIKSDGFIALRSTARMIVQNFQMSRSVGGVSLDL